MSNLSFKDPIVKSGAESSLVKTIESAVIIPGNTHEDLWVHPELVTIPGDPVIMELRTLTTDRHGRDHHTVRHYFRTDDDFQTLQPVESPSAPAWNRIGISVDDLNQPENMDVQLPEMLGHTWASPYLYLEEDIILQAFTTRQEIRDPNAESWMSWEYAVQSLIASKEGSRFTPLHISESWTNNKMRGLFEPHIAKYGGRHFMTVRAEDGHGYVLTSDDRGRSWNKPVPWTWDNGEPIAMHSTMTKLLSHSEGLFLVYTRIRDDNQDVFRNRAPLHIADIDTENLSLIRSTERVIVPDKGLPVGNFWVWPIDRTKSYVVTGEWPRDGRQENGDIWLAKITWRKPNANMLNPLKE